MGREKQSERVDRRGYEKGHLHTVAGQYVFLAETCA